MFCCERSQVGGGYRWHGARLRRFFDGAPVDATCAETAPGSGVFAREWSKASVSVDCNTLEGTIDMLA